MITSKTASEHGAEDATTTYNEWEGTGHERGESDRDAAVRAHLAAMRAGREILPDETLINAMGTGWIAKQAGCTEADGDAINGWCRAYNEAYLATLEQLAS